MSRSPNGVFIGLDFGPRKIGIAVGQTVTRTTQGVATIQVTSGGQHMERLLDIIGEWNARGLVVGVPLDSEGKETAMSAQARKFGREVHMKSGLPVYWVNEYLTSQQAHSELLETLTRGQRLSKKRQAKRDQLAAELILRSYFESESSRR